MAFDETKLTPDQIAELKASAISPAIAEKQGLYSISDAKAAAKLFGRPWQAWEGHLPVLVYPYWLPFHTDPVLVRGKPAKPFEVQRKTDGTVSLAKYVQAKGTGTHIMFGPSLVHGAALNDVTVPIVLTEGEKKLLAAESAGFACIALPGVSQWHIKGEKTLHPYFTHVKLVGRIFFMCFDSDALLNKDVRREELAFGRALEAAGATVFIVRFPQDTGKLDDYLATHEVTEFAQLLEVARKGGRLPPDVSRASVSEEWADVFSKLRLDADTGLPIKDVDNIHRVLMHHPAWEGVLAFDARRERQIFRKQPPFAADAAVGKAPIPRPFEDSDTTRVGDWLVAQGCLGWTLQPTPRQLDQAINIVCEHNRFDTVRDYLVGLKWDQTPRLDTGATTYFGAPDTVYTRAVFAKWMLSAVARARTPGCQVDHVLVLEGPQGLGKSTALKVLAGGKDFFSDALPEIPSRDAHEHCIGPWIIELAELDHMRRAEVTALKTFISQCAPGFRSAYGKRTAEHPRRCVFAATTNESTYLADSTGNRRFWPIECTKADSAAIGRDRDQLWAEALHRVRAGEQWHITDPDVREAAEEEQQGRRQIDPWQAPIVKFIRGRQHVTVGEVLDYLGHGPEESPSGFGSYQRDKGAKGRTAWNYDQKSANRVAAVLRELGWVRRMVRVDGYRVWQYVDERAPARGSTSDKGVSGDTPVTGQALEFIGKSPVSPVSPLDPLYTGAHARATSAPATDPLSSSSPSSSSSFINNSGDSSDSGEKVEDSDSSPVTTVSPVPGGSSDTAGKRRRL